METVRKDARKERDNAKGHSRVQLLLRKERFSSLSDQ
jgi:hypothetical protein